MGVSKVTYNCLKCDYLNKIDKTYPHKLGIELKCKRTKEPRLIEYIDESELIRMTKDDCVLGSPTWCPLNE